MARQIIWSARAINDRKQILRYWTIRNKSDVYSVALRQKIKLALAVVSNNPNIGRQFDFSTRYIVLQDYKIFYSFTKEVINVITIWDTRRNPEELRVK